MSPSPEKGSSRSERKKRQHAEILLNYLSELQNCLFKHLETSGYHDFCPDVLCLSLLPLDNKREPEQLFYFISTEKQLAIQLDGSKGQSAFVVDKENPKKIRVKVKRSDGQITEVGFSFFKFSTLNTLSKKIKETPASQIVLHEACLPKNIIRDPIQIEFNSSSENTWDLPLGEDPVMFNQ